MHTLQQIVMLLTMLIRDLGNPSRETMQQYQQDVIRILAGKTNIKAAATHYRYRAALKWHFQMQAAQMLHWFDEMGPYARPDDYPALIAQMSVTLEVLQFLDGGTDNIQENLEAELHAEFTPHVAATSKRDGLDSLPTDWRELMLEAVKDRPEHWIPLMLLNMTGIRPRELNDGIWLTYLASENQLKITIPGAKVTADRGQPERELNFELLNRPDLSQLMHLLNVHPGNKVRYRFPKRALGGLVARLSCRLFPDLAIPVSPILFRHQLSADLKVAGRERGEIARFLGHRSVRTQGRYGRKKSGRRGGILPAKVSATHPIRSESHIVSGPLEGANPVPAKGPGEPH